MRRSYRRAARAGVLIASAVLVVATGGVMHGTAARSAEVGNWPMFHHDSSHSGKASETTIRASNVNTLGVAWESNTGGTIYSSPAVAYNQKLHERLVYVGNKKGVSAYDATTGERVWFRSAGNVYSSPAVVNGVVYAGSSNHYLYALDAATGALDCRFLSAGVISSSPLVVNPDGNGVMVYFGDNGLTGQDDGGDEWAINGVDPNPAADCSDVWQFNDFRGDLTGSWSPPAFARDANGTPLDVFGTSSPGDSVVALNALTGVQQWVYYAPVGDDTDVGAGPTVSAPGVNGFADGAVYVGTKYGVFLALDLTTGALYWQYNGRDDGPPDNPTGFRSTAALVGSDLYFGSSTGVYAFNAKNGQRLWLVEPLSTTASPAITGPSGDRTLIIGDMSGTMHALSLKDGSELWSNDTGASFIFSSPAISNGTVFVGTPNGFLLAYELGGSSGTKPDTAVSTPADGSTVPNPNGSLQTTGTATDDTGVNQVMVAIHNKSTGRWWDGSSWNTVYEEIPAALDNPGGTSTNWSYTFPVPFAGGDMTVQADAVDADGQRDPSPASSDFLVPSLGNPPTATITEPVRKEVFNFPLNPDGTINHTPFPIDIAGTATDPGGTHVGIAAVYVTVKNIQHQEYYCGPAGCPGDPSVFWAEHPVHFAADMDSPGAASTNWSASFPVYDHPHTYTIRVVAIDEDGERNTTKPSVGPICVNDPGDFTCG
jgi:outer membrane protein assembly factor BamB